MAQDVRDEWRAAILDGLAAEDATTRLVDSFDDYLGGDADEDTERLFWMALAAAQFETGRLLPAVRDRALAIIERGGDVERWRDDGDEGAARQRAQVLERLAAKLRGPQPKKKRLRRSPSYSIPLDVGDAVRVREQDGRDAIVLVVGHLDAGNERHPVVAALDWDGGPIPDREALSRLPIIPDPYAPARPLLIDVFTLSKTQVFGPKVGEVVAQGVTRKEPPDPKQFGRSMHWGLVASCVHEARVVARERAGN